MQFFRKSSSNSCSDLTSDHLILRCTGTCRGRSRKRSTVFTNRAHSCKWGHPLRHQFPYRRIQASPSVQTFQHIFWFDYETCQNMDPVVREDRKKKKASVGRILRRRQALVGNCKTILRRGAFVRRPIRRTDTFSPGRFGFGCFFPRPPAAGSEAAFRHPPRSFPVALRPKCKARSWQLSRLMSNPLRSLRPGFV